MLKIYWKKKNDPSKYYPFGIGGHYNERGYRDIANIIYNYTKK